MGTPVFKLVFDRRKRASKNKEGAIELRITYNRIQKHATTGVRVLPRHWRNGCIVNRTDAFELQHTLDLFVAHARKTVNELIEQGTLDMQTVVAVIGGKQKQQSSENLPKQRLLMDFFRERTVIRTYGRGRDSRERYERFLRWFEGWGGMTTFSDISELNIIRMDQALDRRGMTTYSKWQNYHRFLNSFILDAINEGIMQKNPYKSLHIKKEKASNGLSKYLTLDEFSALANMNLSVDYLRHARDLFLFQTYTCLAYTDLEAFDPSRIKEVNGKPMYVGRRGKTNQEFSFMLLAPAKRILDSYGGQLPIMSNQKYNQYLKMLATMAGIDKPVSSHWARHTGATMLLNSGVGMEVVSKVLGHSSTKITREVYAKLLDETVAEAMSRMERMMSI